MTNGIYPWSFMTQIFLSNLPSHDGDHTTFEMIGFTSFRFS